MICICHTCGESYHRPQSTCEIRGYCSQACMWKKLQRMGWHRAKLKKHGLTAHAVLSKHGLVGDLESAERRQRGQR